MDDKAAFGFYPQLKPKRTTQDPEAAKNAPIDFLRGRVAGTLGMPGDIEQLARDLAMLAGASESRSFLPTTERVLPNIPLGSNTPVSRAAAGLGSLTANPFDVVKAGKLAGKAAKAAKPEVGQALEEYMFKQGLALPATVYHGSPHKFEKFDSSKIGTGEGAQAYGHGLYLAESPEVAEQYRQALSTYKTTLNGVPLTPDHPQFSAAMHIGAKGYKAALKQAQEAKRLGFITPEFADEEIAKIVALKDAKIKSVKEGSVYKVDLPDEVIAKMLDWDKPLSQQHPDVQAALSKTPLPPETTGAEAYEWLQQIGGGTKEKSQAFASRHLLEKGIPGIRYLDADSRAAGKGTSNFVVFPGEEDVLTILERNQQPIKKESTPPTEMAKGGLAFMKPNFMAEGGESKPQFIPYPRTFEEYADEALEKFRNLSNQGLNATFPLRKMVGKASSALLDDWQERTIQEKPGAYLGKHAKHQSELANFHIKNAIRKKIGMNPVDLPETSIEDYADLSPFPEPKKKPMKKANGGSVSLDAMYMAVNDAKFRRK
jgi:hypothetical protein